MGAWLDSDGMCAACGDYARDCVCDMCETCDGLAPSGTMETCGECGSLVCETCDECMACAPVCERCDERARDLASARPDDWNAPSWCGACRAAMFTPRDVIVALGRVGIGARWVDLGGDDYRVIVAHNGATLTISEGLGAWTEHDDRLACACVAVDYDAADGTGAESWLEDVSDIVALVREVTA